jgi:cytochrome oxidase Cu insertion factor (SCO1/SenC/PrrC family)
LIQPAGNGEVLDHHGAPLRLHSLLQGRVTVLSFIYTRCGAMRACPYATGILNELHQTAGADPQLAQQLQLITLSFDPEKDTPERMASYSRWARERHAAVPWYFLTTRSERELQPILEAYGQAVDRRRNPADPRGPLFHTLRVFLIDSSGQVRNIYNSDTLDARLVLADIQTLLMQPHAS